MRKLLVASLAVALLAGCHGDPLGKPCKVDNDCGPGFDCYPDVCVQVCTKADECPQGQTCYRYHCIVPGQEHASRSRPPTAPGAPTPVPPPAPPGVVPPSVLSQGPGPTAPTTTRVMTPPPLPDTTAAELRAIRRELEILAAEQVKLTAAVEELKKSGVRTDKPVAPVKEPAKKP